VICFGNVPAGAVLPIFFSTYAGSTGASVTLTGLAVTDIEIYKGTSITQRSSDAGYALIDTDGIDVDGVTGIHAFSVDTGDNTDSGFFAAGSFYTVVVSAVTVDSQTVNFIAATFRLVAAESSAGVNKSDVSHFGGTAGTFSSGRPEVNTTHLAGQTVTAGAGVTFPSSVASPTNITAGTITTATNVTTVNGLANNVITAASINADAITAAKVAADVTTEIQSGLATAAALATVDTVVDAIKAVTDLLPDAGALTSLATAAALATVDTVADAVKAKTDSLTFTQAGVVDANITHVNEAAVGGDGQPGTEWGPA
jgi:hypothetical protein